MMLHIIVLIAMYLLENIEVGAVKPIYLAHVIEQPNFRIPNPQYFVYLLDQTVGGHTLQFIY